MGRARPRGDEGQEATGSCARRLAAGGLATLALLAMIALASRAGPVWAGESPAAGHASDRLLTAALAVLAVAAIGSLALIGGALRPARPPGEEPRPGDGAIPGHGRAVLVTAAVGLAALAVLVAAVVTLPGAGSDSQPTRPSTAPAPTGVASPAVPSERSGGRDLDWLALALAGALSAAVLGVVALTLGRASRGGPDEAARVRVRLAVEDTARDPEAERDPRRAVVAAYAGMERSLGAHGVPRRAPETPVEYLARVFGGTPLSPGPAERLTSLYERARFSHHRIDLVMRDQAVAALGDIRRELGERE